MNIIELYESLKGCINETFRVLKDNEIRQHGGRYYCNNSDIIH